MFETTPSSVRKYIQWYLQDTENYSAMISIHFIEVTINESIIDIKITLSRPGLLIGKGGKYLNTLIASLTSFFEIAVDINLQEFDPFI